jgi:uncharacterized membrane protein HdeD (DUF308 family)
MQTMNFESARSLKKLYFTRTGFQVLWAASVIGTAVTKPAVAAILLILYPLWDVACTIYDLKTSALDRSAKTSQTINAVLGIAAAIGIALTVFDQPRYAVAVFGAWALVAGLLQFVAGLLRRKQLGGQWAMILSGLQSTVAGAAFVMGGLQGKMHVKDVGGYAIFGAIYFLIAGVRLARKVSKAAAASAMGTREIGHAAL